MRHVFVSYKAEDRPRVRPLVEALTAEGLDVWWDVHLEGGANWRETISRHLDEAACVIVAWSEASVGPAGHFVQDEASRARRRGVYLPVAIDAVEAPLGFGQDHALKLIGWRGDPRDPRFQDVLAAARAMAAGEAKPRPVARAQARRPRPGWLPALSGLAVVGLIAALVVVGAPARLCEAAGWACPALGVAPPGSVAVLPFANLSGDPAQAYFSDGLTEELIATLARLPQLKVVARASAFRFRGSEEGAVAIGAKLGVAYLLDGSVRREGAVVRVSTQLIDAHSGYELWSHTYERDMRDIFAVQSGVAQAVAEAMKVQLHASDLAALGREGTLSPEAYDAYLRGRALLEAGGDEAVYRQALARFDAAIAADPRYAVAHAARASALVDIANRFLAPAAARQAYDDALASARRAADLAPDIPIVQAILAGAYTYARRDLAAAGVAFARARAGGGGDSSVLLGSGLFACERGDFRAGLPDLRRAVTLDPLDALPHAELGRALVAARLYEEAVASDRRALAISPTIGIVHAAMGDALALQGRLAEARAEYAFEPTTWARLTGEAIVLRRMGDRAGAGGALRALLAGGVESSAYQIAQVKAQWGDLDGAFAALDIALRLNDPGLLMIKVDPWLDPLRRDSRFAARLARAGFAGPV
jgi:TolB-like protein/tetratricopeptide (TPR) repeat protein